MSSALQALQDLVSAPPLEVYVNGRPLTAVVSSLVQALNAQQKQFEELRDYTYRTNQEQWDRIVALEASVARLDNDVAITERPVTKRETLHSALVNIDRRVNLLNFQRKCAAAANLRATFQETLRQRTLHKWLQWRRLRAAVAVMNRQSGDSTLKRYFRKWSGYKAERKRQRAQIRHVASLRLTAQRHHVQLTFGRWREYCRVAAAQREELYNVRLGLATKMLTITARGHCRNRYRDWIDFALMRRRMHVLADAATKMQIISSRSLVLRYVAKWQKAERMNRRKRQRRVVAAALSLESEKAHLRRRFLSWLGLVRRRAARLASVAIIPRMHHAACLRLALRYFGKLGRNVTIRAQRRQRSEIHGLFGELSHRCDSLATQLDVSLRTLSNTNTAMSKIVSRIVNLEKMATVPHPHAALSTSVTGRGSGGGHRTLEMISDSFDPEES